MSYEDDEGFYFDYEMEREMKENYKFKCPICKEPYETKDEASNCGKECNGGE